jgi:hypothetical protein
MAARQATGGGEASPPERGWATDPATLVRVSQALARQLPAEMAALESAVTAAPADRPLPRRLPGRHVRGRA